MRRVGVLLAVALLVLLTRPPLASADPAPLCEPDLSRGGVPVGFVVEACVDAGGVTLRNSLDVPIAVRTTGDLGTAVRLDSASGQDAALTRLTDGRDDVLMPHDVVRWPVGSGAAGLTIDGLEPAAIPAIVAAVRTYLPRRDDGGEREDGVTGPQGAHGAFAGLVREVAAALDEWSACQDGGKNFLSRAACDVDAAGRIGRVASAQLTRGEAAEMTPLLLDRDRWQDWVRATPDAVGTPAERTLRLASLGLPVAAPPAVPGSSGVVAGPAVPPGSAGPPVVGTGPVPAGPAAADPAPTPPVTPAPKPPGKPAPAEPVPVPPPAAGQTWNWEWLQQLADAARDRHRDDGGDHDRDDDRHDEDPRDNGKDNDKGKDKGKNKNKDGGNGRKD